jgi:hypothetical protein
MRSVAAWAGPRRRFLGVAPRGRASTTSRRPVHGWYGQFPDAEIDNVRVEKSDLLAA